MNKNFLKSTFIAGAFLFGSAFAQADEIGVDLTNYLGQAEEGITYSLESKGDYFTYVPTQSGVIKVQTNYSGNYDAIGYEETCFFFMYDYAWASGPGTYAFEIAQVTPEIENGGYQFLFYVREGREYVIGYGINVHTALDFTITRENEVIPAALTY